jgi:hypothetical protein
MNKELEDDLRKRDQSRKNEEIGVQCARIERATVSGTVDKAEITDAVAQIRVMVEKAIEKAEQSTIGKMFTPTPAQPTA